MNIKITKITLLVPRHGTDKIYMDTELPAQYVCTPEVKASLMMDVTAGTGVEYCRVNFPGIPVEVVNMNGD